MSFQAVEADWAPSLLPGHGWNRSGLQGYKHSSRKLPQTGPARLKRYLNAKHFGMLWRFFCACDELGVNRSAQRRVFLHIICGQDMHVKCNCIAKGEIIKVQWRVCVCACAHLNGIVSVYGGVCVCVCVCVCFSECVL